jgi:hypothetical protein
VPNVVQYSGRWLHGERAVRYRIVYGKPGVAEPVAQGRQRLIAAARVLQNDPLDLEIISAAISSALRAETSAFNP